MNGDLQEEEFAGSDVWGKSTSAVLGWRMQNQFLENSIGEPTRDALGNFSVREIPGFRLWFHGQLGRRILGAPNLLETTDINFSNQLETALGRFFDIVAK